MYVWGRGARGRTLLLDRGGGLGRTVEGKAKEVLMEREGRRALGYWGSANEDGECQAERME